MVPPMLRLRATIVPLLIALLVAPASAGETDARTNRAAMKHYDRGLKLYMSSDFSGARDEFQAARDLVDAPQFLFNLAQCARNLGEHEDAVKLYEEFLLRMPEAPNRAKVEEYVAAERALLPVEPPPPPKVEAPPPPPKVEPPPPPPPAPPTTRLWQRKWFWYAAGGAAAVVLIVLTVGLSVGLSGTSGTELGLRDLGTLVRF